jgi:hypothetical protein
VVLHDSFIVGLRPFLAEHFRQARYLWTHDFPTEVISGDRPCVVIQELVEWKLMEYQPTNPPAINVAIDYDQMARPSSKILR